MLCIVFGGISFSREYFFYIPRNRTLEWLPPLSRRRLYKGTGQNALIVEGKRIILVRANGKRKKVPVRRYMSRAEDWDAVVDAIKKKSAKS